MIKIMYELWDKNKEKLLDILKHDENLNSCDYGYLVKLTFDVVFNDEDDYFKGRLDTDRITMIDDGDYQGTYLYLIPFATYQPSECEYLMTYVDYGSCSGCDTLQYIQSLNYDAKPTEKQLKEYMTLCLDLVRNTIKPYNIGWRYDSKYDIIDF